MKSKTIIYISLMLLAGTTLMAKNYNITPMNIDFNGVISNGDNVVIYGSNGYYYYSEDAAKTWEERKIVEQANIKKIVKYKDDFYGIIESGSLIKSTDKGNSWIVKDYDKDSIDKFIAMDINQDKFFVRSIDKIIEFDLDLEFKSLHQDSLLFYNENDSSYKSTNARDLIAYHKGKIYLPYSSRRILILSDNYKILSNKSLEECNPILKGKSPFITGLDYFKDSLMIGVYSLNKYIDYKFLIGEDNYENNWKLLPIDSSLHIKTNIYNDNLYGIEQDLSATGNVDEDWKYSAGIPKNLYLTKYDLNKNNLVVVGNKYLSNFILGNVQTDNIGGSYSGYYELTTKNPYFINESTVIVVGRSKLMFITYDLGKKWELKSFLDGTPNKIFDDKRYVTEGIYSSITSDGGLTYTPREIIDTTACHHCRFSNYLQMYFTPKGEGFFHGMTAFDNYANVGFTKDTGKTIQFKSDPGFYTQTFKFATNFALIGDEYYNISNNKTTVNDLQLPSTWVTYGYYFNKNDFSKYRREVLDTSKHKYYYIFPQNKTSFTEVLQSIEANYPADQYLEIRSTTDGGESWISEHKIKNYSENYKFYEHNKDSLFITSYELTYYGDIDYMNRVYLYDRTRGTLDTLFKEDDVKRSNLQMVYFDKNFYIMGDNILKIGNSDLTKWDEVPNWPTKNPSFADILFKDNMILAKYSDEVRKDKNFYLNNYYKIVADNTTSVESPKIALRTYSAYPNPATNMVKAELYWESGFDIRESIKGVYDINGNLVADKYAIKLTNSDNYSGTLEWNCSNYQSGLYFIFIEHGNNKQSVPIMIMK